MESTKRTSKKKFQSVLIVVMISYMVHSLLSLILLTKVQFKEQDKLKGIQDAMRVEYRNGNFEEVATLLIRGDSIHNRVKWIKGFRLEHALCDVYHNEHYTVKGLLELKKGNMELAYKCLIESANVKSTPVLASFGPRMGLAKQFLLLGEKDKTVEYLNLIHSFWIYHRDDIESWIEEIYNDNIPDYRSIRYK